MIEDFYRKTLIKMSIKQIPYLEKDRIIVIKKHTIWTKDIFRTHLGIYANTIVPDRLLNKNKLIHNIRFQITNIEKIYLGINRFYINIYGNIIGTK